MPSLDNNNGLAHWSQIQRIFLVSNSFQNCFIHIIEKEKLYFFNKMGNNYIYRQREGEFPIFTSDVSKRSNILEIRIGDI